MESALRAVVGVMDEIRARSAADDRRIEGRGDELGAHVGRHRPADDPATPGVDDRGEVAGSGPRRERRDVGDPEPVGTRGAEVAVHEIGERCRVLVADRRADEPAAMDAREMVTPHQPRDPLARDVEARVREVGVDAGHPVRAAARGVGAADLRGQCGVRAFPGGGTA